MENNKVSESIKCTIYNSVTFYQIVTVLIWTQKPMLVKSIVKEIHHLAHGADLRNIEYCVLDLSWELCTIRLQRHYLSYTCFAVYMCVRSKLLIRIHFLSYLTISFSYVLIYQSEPAPVTYAIAKTRKQYNLLRTSPGLAESSVPGYPISFAIVRLVWYKYIHAHVFFQLKPWWLGDRWLWSEAAVAPSGGLCRASDHPSTPTPPRFPLCSRMAQSLLNFFF